ncbi:M16 family metallopeptidase [Clostridium luticellarii]|jgi:predicted Zn-dependent peptidase|uniref:Putative zinc protease AlbF n=1 Tax=Clostridium luticellarii TaxID=1691940 RepID=A0A2T0BQ83_9CLOT|nr:pitrilysin family protein [Clostridium luticellarii]MCI1944474.1 insulinase family protein [Clostridium luticellarii]MCI1967973.1 insulinase family protein [Clostridium luticellarii]MCI1995088.1 insulinase family protein [Clostridium luticellarii]MCI2039247.1 insulinase family protein [Clostridium luticellarii]PRR86027.1 putative zinc protease AlbF [Clostridium luticellarii]
MFDAKESILPNGIKLVSIKRDTQIAALHAGVKVGAIYEDIHEKGISHFIEHMLFKGTQFRNNKRLNMDLEALGGEYNAYTDNDATVYSITSLWIELERSMDIISDMLMNSVFPGEEVEKERQVIISEIRSNRDDIEEYSFRKINEAAFRKGPLRYDITGNEDRVGKFQRDDLIEFYNRYYVPNNCFISVVSSCEHEDIYNLVLKYFGKWKFRKFDRNKVIVEKNHPCKKFSYKKDIEQSTIIYLFTFYGLGKKEELALRILNHKFGESSNSILFRKLREEKGLAYDVYSDLDLSDWVKTLYIYTSVKEENIEDAIRVIEDCIDRLKNKEIDFDDDTMSLMKKVLRTGVIFTLEDPTDIGNYVLHQCIKGDSIYKFIYDIEEIESIRKEDIYRVAQVVFKDPTIHILKNRS